MSGPFEQARDFFLRGLAQYQAGQYAQADASLSAALALLPGRPSTLTNLGATRLKLGRPAEALELLQEVLALEPQNVEALGHCASALAELGQPERALASLETLLAVDPAVAHAWSVRGSLLKELGRPGEAAASYREALARGADPQLNGYYLAGLGGAAAPPAPPAHYVEQLFDGYAADFDAHLVTRLNYRAPEVLAARLQAWGRRFESALDLGCGTGLCGPLLRPLAARLTGIDLSQRMLERARQLGVYTDLLHEDAVAYLARTARRYELLVAADVFIYLGALEAVFEGAARVLPARGVFCFSVEEHAGTGEAPDDAGAPDVTPGGVGADPASDFALRPSLRYAHSESYIRRLADHCGFELTDTVRQPLREDRLAPVPGLYFWLTRR